MNPEVHRIYYDNGNIEVEEYSLNDNRHREDGPAYIVYYEDGSINYEEYWLNDKLHRTDGPAISWYHVDGSISSLSWYFKDKEYEFNDWLDVAILSEDDKILIQMEYS